MNNELAIDSLINEVKKKTGLEDFGNDTFKEGLGILIYAYLKESQLNDLGYNFIINFITHCLINRLQVQDWITRHPEILDEKIERPLLITGFPRTGSTFLQTLLSIDPLNRALHQWEANEPCPPPELIYSVSDPRIQNFHINTLMIKLIKPELQAIYPLNAGGFAECQQIMSNEFKSSEFFAGAWIPTYMDWLVTCDMSSAYEYHKKILQLLQWRLPNEGWILKAPVHLIGLDALFNQYPDAQIIFMHRDPIKILASSASLVSEFSSLYSDKIDYYKIADYCSGILVNSIIKAMNSRDRQKPQSFYDIHFHDFISDPINSIKRIYEYFGRKVSCGHERRMLAWIRDNPQGKRGHHRYSLEKFGIDPTEVRKRFALYQERFEIPSE